MRYAMRFTIFMMLAIIMMYCIARLIEGTLMLP